MDVQLKALTFGTRNNPRSPLAPMLVGPSETPAELGTWSAEGSNRPQDSPLVVIDNLLPLDSIQIQVELSRTSIHQERDLRLSVVCTSSPSPAITPFGAELPAQGYNSSTEDHVNFGSFANIRLVFRPGQSTLTSDPFDLGGTELGHITSRDICLHWTIDLDDQEIHCETNHRLYVILAPPSLPWSADPDEQNRWLWTDVLDFACNWARGATSTYEAVERATAKLVELGSKPETQGGLRYQGASNYTSGGQFHCRRFLDHLTGRTPNSHVNCVDLASILSTFANALGCRTSQAQCAKGTLASPVRIFSHPTPQVPGFSFHELVWDGPALATDRVWDACLTIDGKPPVALDFGSYVKEFFLSPPPKAIGPLYISNRFLRSHTSNLTTAKSESLALKRHPELDQLVPAAEASESLSSLHDLLGTLTPGSWMPDSWTKVDPQMETETAFETRYKVDGGAANVRLSIFPDSNTARRFVILQTSSITSQLVSWEPNVLQLLTLPKVYAMRTVDHKTALLQLGNMVVTIQTGFGDFDLQPIIEKVVAVAKPF